MSHLQEWSTKHIIFIIFLLLLLFRRRARLIPSSFICMMTHRHTPAYRHIPNGRGVSLNVILHAEGIFWLGRMTYRRSALGRSRSRWWQLWCGVCVGRGGITGCWLVTHLDPRVVVPTTGNIIGHVTLVAMTRTKCNILIICLISRWAFKLFYKVDFQ